MAEPKEISVTAFDVMTVLGMKVSGVETNYAALVLTTSDGDFNAQSYRFMLDQATLTTLLTDLTAASTRL